MEEIWKDIKGYEGLYQVSNLGNVKSLNYNKTGREKLLKQIETCKYNKINLVCNGKAKQLYVHILVAFAFPEICGEWFEGAEVNHKDENKRNNNATNLEWCTRKYNVNYGTARERIILKLTNGSKSKTVLQYDLNGNFIKEWPSTREIERQLGYKHSNISACCRGKQITAYGYKWKD